MTRGPAEAELDALVGRDGPDLSVWAGTVDGSAWLTRRPDAVHLAASTMKLPLVVALHRLAEQRAVDLDEEVRVHADFRSAGDGGPYEVTQDYDNDDEPWKRLGRTATLRWLAERAIVRSSNLATNLLVERVGVDATDEVYAAVGATGCALRKGIQDRRADMASTVTADGLARVVAGLVSGRLLPPAAAAEVERLLAASQWNDAIPAGLPDGAYVANKSGWTDDVCHDVGVVRPAGEPPLVLAVLSTRRPGLVTEAQACAFLADAVAVVWRHRPPSSREARRGTQ